MNPSIHTIQPAQLQQLQYTVKQPLDDSWSAPMSYAAAQETAAREPDLQACAILPDGTTTAPAPFAEIYTRAAGPRTPRDIETAAALHQRNERVQAQRTAATAPQPSPAPARQPSAAPLPSAANQAAAIPAETLTLLRHALRLFLIVTYGTLYIASAGAIIGGLAGGQNARAVSGIILLILTAGTHVYLTDNHL